MFLGNRCHNRVSRILPDSLADALGLPPDGVGEVAWPDGRKVSASFRHIYKKDEMLHNPVFACLRECGMVEESVWPTST